MVHQSLFRTGKLAAATILIIAIAADSRTSVGGAALLAQSAKQPADDRARIVGTWELIEFTNRNADGVVAKPFGETPAGRITYDADGNMLALLMHEYRNEAAGKASPADVAESFSAYFGRYSVDSSTRRVTHRVQGSLSAVRASEVLVRDYVINGDDLILTFSRPKTGITNTLRWRRMRY